jgi:hypothetical protein
VGEVEVISIVEVATVFLDTVSLLCGFAFTRRLTVAAFCVPEPMVIGSNGPALTGVE